MSYTINPNAKNGWVRNAENTMDLSIETDASSVYLDDGRTLEQEIGEGSMVSNVATVDTSMSKVIEGTLDGAYESGVMYGRSLVNLCRDSWWNGTLTNSYDIAQQLKPNTKYIVLVNSVENIENISLATSKHSPIVYGEREGNMFKFITPSNTIELAKVRILLSQSPTSEPFYGALLLEYQEGMENWDIPYFEGICDVKMPILRNVGKNLFDINGDINQKFDNMLGSLNNVRIGENSFIANNYTNSHHGRGMFLNLKPNTEYTLSGHCENAGEIDFHAREQVNYLTGCFSGDFKWTINTGSYTNFCLAFITMGNSSANKAIFSNIQLEESLSPTPYEDHKTNILRTSEEIVLRGVGGVQDTYNPLTGEYVQRIREVVLDGSNDEEYVQSGLTLDNTIAFGAVLRDIKFKGASINNKFITTTSDNNDYEHSYNSVYNNKNLVWFFINKRKLSSFNVNGFRQWLSQNPITLQYELDTPIIKTVDPNGYPFAYENGHIILESGYEGQSLLPTLEYSTVINRTGQIQSIANTVQKQEKQITKLEQMLIQNIVDLDYNNTLLTLKNEMEEML